MQKIIIIGDKNPAMRKNEVIGAFLSEDWDTLFVSALIVALDLLIHFVVDEYYHFIFAEHQWYIAASFGIALVFGYAGQRMIYKYLGSAERYLDKKVEDKLK